MKTIVFEDVRDFDLTHIFECGQCFRWVPADDGTGDYIGAAGKNAARISYDPETECLTVLAAGGDEAFWRRYFDLQTDYSSIKDDLIMRDPGIAEALKYGGGIRILNQDLFEILISFIISQNNNIPRIRKNIESICAAYGEYIGKEFGREWYTFPDPSALADAEEEDLAAMKLGYRAGYIISASRKYMSDCSCHCIPHCREDVLAYRGVGPKVANCIMLFGLRHTDAFPVDTWVKHIMNDMYGFDESDMKGMERFAHERFGPLSGYAQQYLFYYYRYRGRQQ